MLLALFCGCRCPTPIVQLDAGTDAGAVDAGAVDAGAVDAGAADAGVSDAGTPDAGVSFCEAYVAAVCGWYARCGQLDAPLVEDCRALQRWQCHQQQVDAVVDAGKVSLAAAQVPRCLNGIAAASCAQNFPRSSECDLFSPATPNGGTCTRQWSTVCANGYCRGTACPATCSAHLAPHAGCDGPDTDACGPGAFCNFASPRVCEAFVPVGAPCTAPQRCALALCDSVQGRCTPLGALEADAGCGSDDVCAVGLYCGASRCRSRETLGGPCRLYGGGDCDEPFTCRIPDAGTMGTCQPRSGDGGVCYGLPNDCRDGLLCDNTALFNEGRCVGFESDGVACSRRVQNCKVGLVCDAITSRCRRLPRVGEPCVRDPGNFRSSDCAGGFCPVSDGGPQRCQPPQAPGGACERPWECASSECDQGACAALCTTF